MNNRAPFQVIAIIPDDDDASTEKVKQAVAGRFDIDLTHYSREYQEEGVCIQHALTLEDALITSMVVQDLGASCRVLDATGKVVTDVGPSHGAAENEEPELELDQNRDFSGGATSAVTEMGEDDLMMLDGAIGDLSGHSIPELGDPKIREAVTTRPELRGVDADLIGPDLELDDINAAVVGTEFEVPDAMEFPELGGDDEAKSHAVKGDDGLFKELDDSLSGKPSRLDTATEEEFQRPARPRVHSPALDDMGSRSRRPSQAVATRGGMARSSRATMSTASSGPVMFGGWFRQRPRLRIVIGFLLALGLGSVVPAVQASGAFKARVKPLMVELSTARANETRAVKTPGIPSSRSVAEKLDNSKTENFAYTLAIWLGCFLGIAVLWFKFC